MKNETEDNQPAKKLQLTNEKIIRRRYKLNTILVWVLGVLWITLVVAFINLNFFREDEEALQLSYLSLQLLIGCTLLFAAFLIRQVVLWIKLINFEANK